MTIYTVSVEEQAQRNKLLQEVFSLEDVEVEFEEYTVESVPYGSPESQSRPGPSNGMYGRKWGDAHPKGMRGKKHSEETKQNMSKKRKGSTPWNLGVKSPEHAEFMKTKMMGNSHAKGIKYPKFSCLCCRKEYSSNRLARHVSVCTNNRKVVTLFELDN